MQNIDPFLLVEPVIFIAISAGLVIYWRVRRRLTGIVLVFSLVAYAGAIALKEVVQAVSASWVTSTFGEVSAQTGLYYGIQTSVFEVGLAYLVARYAVSRRRISGADSEGYGISLAFWENGMLLGAVTLFNLLTTYFLISAGLIPGSVYQTIVDSQPSLFYSPAQLAGPIALGVLERISSLLLHSAWGYLTVLAAVMRKRVYLYLALPMGLVDATVPFAPELPLWEYEAILFALSLAVFSIAWAVAGKDRRSGYGVGSQSPKS